MTTCESCGGPADGVYSVPGVPYSAAYCKACAEKDSHPMWILIANTAMLGGLEQAAGWWREMVEHSLRAQNKTMEWFNGEVKKAVQAFEQETP